MSGQNIMAICAACAITVVGLAASLPANAEPITITGPSNEDRVVERVSYRDLNLALGQDERRLVRRVGIAVSSVCSTQIAYAQTARCRSFAWSGARPQIARAVERARQMALNGFSSIAPVTIVIAIPH